jgi:hypothetical protein
MRETGGSYERGERPRPTETPSERIRGASPRDAERFFSIEDFMGRKLFEPVESPAARAESRPVETTTTAIRRLRERIETTESAAIGHDHRGAIPLEHRREALYVLDDIEICLSLYAIMPEAYVEAVGRARKSGNFFDYSEDVLRRVLTELAKEILVQVAAPGLILPPDDLISALFAAADLAEYVGG